MDSFMPLANAIRDFETPTPDMYMASANASAFFTTLTFSVKKQEITRMLEQFKNKMQRH